MIKKRQFSTKEAQSIGTQLKIDWLQVDLEQFRRGLEVDSNMAQLISRPM